jgi:AcrR family transcriptional regulator
MWVRVTVAGISATARPTQADRRARTRSALLESAARGLSKYGYANLVLERVASEAGYTRGALYHLFANKEDLALAVVKWVEETWDAEVGQPAAEEADPVDALLAIARGHAVYCRRDVARVMMTLRVEFAGQDHPVGRAIAEIVGRLAADCAGRIAAGRRSGAIPPGPPPREMASAYLGVLEAVGIQLAGHAPYDAELADRAVRGLLGLPPTPTSTDPRSVGASRPPARTDMEIHE